MIMTNMFFFSRFFKDSYNLGFVLNDKIRPAFFRRSFHNFSKFLRRLFLSFTTV